MTTSASAYGSGGGTGALNVTVSRECAWSATTEAAWVVFTSAREGQGDGSVAYRIQSNDVPVSRRGAVAVGEVRVELSQEGAPCRYQVSAPNEPIAPGGGERTVDVRTHAACSWTALSTVPWATVTPSSGRGDGAVRVAFSANDGATRTAAIAIAGQRIALTQIASAVPPAPPTPGPTPTPPPAPTPTPTPSPTPTPTPTPGEKIEIEGKVENRSGACPSLTFTLRGRTVWTTAATEIKKGSCKDIRNGSELEVEGRRMSDGTVRADEIKIEER